MGMARAILKTSGIQDQYSDLAVQHATYLKNCLLSASLGDSSPEGMVFQYKPAFTHIRIFGSRVQAWLPSQEWEGKLADRTRASRYVGHSGSDSLCIVQDKMSDRLIHRSRTRVFEDVDLAAVRMSAKPPDELDNDSFILRKPVSLH